jgi:hypothetical protein
VGPARNRGNINGKAIAANQTLVYNETRSSGSSSVVERDLAKVDVAGSTPVSRSMIPPADFHACGWRLGRTTEGNLDNSICKR